MDENLTFWTILPLGTKMWNWNSRAAVNALRAQLSHIRGRDSNTRLDLGFVIILLQFCFLLKNVTLNHDF